MYIQILYSSITFPTYGSTFKKKKLKCLTNSCLDFGVWLPMFIDGRNVNCDSFFRDKSSNVCGCFWVFLPQPTNPCIIWILTRISVWHLSLPFLVHQPQWHPCLLSTAPLSTLSELCCLLFLPTRMLLSEYSSWFTTQVFWVSDQTAPERGLSWLPHLK